MATLVLYGSDLNRPGYPDEGITGIREQLSDICDISPTETPSSPVWKRERQNTYVEWQTAELRPAQIAGEIEGDDTDLTSARPFA